MPKNWPKNGSSLDLLGIIFVRTLEVNSQKGSLLVRKDAQLDSDREELLTTRILRGFMQADLSSQFDEANMRDRGGHAPRTTLPSHRARPAPEHGGW